MDEKLKQDDSESDQSDKSKMMAASPTLFGTRRESLSSKTSDGKEPKKEEKSVVFEDSKSDDIEEINYKEMLNRYTIHIIFFFLKHNIYLIVPLIVF